MTKFRQRETCIHLHHKSDAKTGKIHFPQNSFTETTLQNLIHQGPGFYYSDISSCLFINMENFLQILCAWQVAYSGRSYNNGISLLFLFNILVQNAWLNFIILFCSKPGKWDTICLYTCGFMCCNVQVLVTEKASILLKNIKCSGTTLEK